MPPNRVARAVVNDHRGSCAEHGEPQTQTHEAPHGQRRRGRRTPWQENQGICLPGHPLALPLVENNARMDAQTTERMGDGNRFSSPEPCLAVSIPRAGLGTDTAVCPSVYRPVAVYLLYAPLTIPLAYCHINRFQQAPRLASPLHGGENMTTVWAAYHEERCSDGVMSSHVCDHIVVPHRWVVLD